MSQYVKANNREMIWNIFRKIPEASQFTEAEQRSLVTSAISHFYHKINPNIHLSREQLQDINKQTLTFLLDQVQRPPIKEQKNIIYHETADQKIQRIFAEKQKMYDSMTAKPVVPKPSELFQDPVMDNDEAIDNIDERLSRMVEERNKEYDVQEINKPTTSTKNSTKTVIEILEDLSERLEKIEKMLSARLMMP